MKKMCLEWLRDKLDVPCKMLLLCVKTIVRDLGNVELERRRKKCILDILRVSGSVLL